MEGLRPPSTLFRYRPLKTHHKFSSQNSAIRKLIVIYILVLCYRLRWFWICFYGVYILLPFSLVYSFSYCVNIIYNAFVFLSFFYPRCLYYLIQIPNKKSLGISTYCICSPGQSLYPISLSTLRYKLHYPYRCWLPDCLSACHTATNATHRFVVAATARVYLNINVQYSSIL